MNFEHLALLRVCLAPYACVELAWEEREEERGKEKEATHIFRFDLQVSLCRDTKQILKDLVVLLLVACSIPVPNKSARNPWE